ncbi:MAG: hypothetical protein ACLUUF_04935 [Bifidobacterium pullorum]
MNDAQRKHVSYLLQELRGERRIRLTAHGEPQWMLRRIARVNSPMVCRFSVLLGGLIKLHACISFAIWNYVIEAYSQIGACPQLTLAGKPAVSCFVFSMEGGLEEKANDGAMVMDAMAGYRGGHWLDDEDRAERIPA